jgi:hypothetical protein
VNHAESVRFLRVNQRGAQRQARIGVKIRGCVKRHRPARRRMGEGKFRRVQKRPRHRGATVKRVAENRKPALRRYRKMCFRDFGWPFNKFGFLTAIGTLLKAMLGLWLFFGARGFANFWRFLRNAGTPKPPPES